MIYRSILILSLVGSLMAGDDDKTSLEAFIFGKSYHFNRTVPWHETNPGVAVGLAHATEAGDLLVTVGGYRDSYGEQAKFALLGIRGYLGDRHALHVTGGLSLGYYQGSGNHGTGLIPIVSIGYNRVDLCVTGDWLSRNSNENAQYRADGSIDPHSVDSSSVAVFLKVRVYDF